MGVERGAAQLPGIRPYRSGTQPARKLEQPAPAAIPGIGPGIGTMHNGYRLSIVMPAYNEAEGIAQAVRSFRAIPEVDEVVVADNNSKDGTAELARQAGARVVSESRQGYGFASQCALSSAIGDYIVITESDGTFRASDLRKFLAYAGEFDAVFGTRTAKSCIWEGSNMGNFLRYGNCGGEISGISS
jgi:dolichol-phosphate mannosyltransferase